MGSLHRKQKISYVKKPNDLDLLDASSEVEIESFTLEERANVLSVQGWLVDPRN